MERSTKDLVECAKELAKKVQRLRQERGVDTPIYLASDVALDGRAMSRTIHSGTESAVEALKVLVKEVGQPYTWTDALPFHEAERITDLHTRAAILDRVAMMYSTLFVGVSPGCSKGNNSTYRKRIVGWRAQHGLEFIE
jgi:hypothetical protein